MRNNLKLFILFLVVNIALIPSAYSTISKSIDLIYWTPFSGGDARPMLNIVNAFNQSQMDINVRMKLFAWTKYYPELIYAMESGKVPDIAIVHSSKLGEMASTGMISDINIIAKSAGIHWDDFSENTLKETIINDKHLAIPLDTHALIMFYNKTYLKKAGLLDKNENLLMKSGVEGFISFLKTLKKTLPKNVAPFGSPTNNDYPFWIWYALYSQIEGGGSYIVNGKAAFNNAPARKALDVLIAMRDQELWPEKIHDKKGYNMFKFGYAATIFSGVWSTWYYEQNNKLDFGTTTIPQIFDKPATWGDSHTFILPKQPSKERQVAAAKFADWMTDHGTEWAVAGHIPSKKSVLRSNAYRKLKHRPSYAKVITSVNYFPKNNKLWKCNDKMVEIFVKMMNRELNVEETIITAEKEVNKILME